MSHVLSLDRTYRGISHFRSPASGSAVSLHFLPGALSLWHRSSFSGFWCGSLDPPGANPFCFQPSRPPATRPTWLARPPSLAHLHHLTFWSPRLALAPHPDTTQDPVLLRGKGHFHRRPPVFSGDLGDLGRRGRESAQEVSRVHSMDRPGGTTL